MQRYLAVFRLSMHLLYQKSTENTIFSKDLFIEHTLHKDGFATHRYLQGFEMNSDVGGHADIAGIHFCHAKWIARP